MEKIPVRYVQEPLALMVNGELRLNPRNTVFWNDPGRFGARQHAAGFWSSADPGHVVFHETGHEAQVKRLHHFLVTNTPAKREPDIFTLEWVRSTFPEGNMNRAMEEIITPELAPRILAQVGRHALTTTQEFVAEVFAGRMAGRQYDPEIMQLYEDWFGQVI
jgi:hypothetical protein